MSLIHELKRRRVFQTFALYIVAAWVIIQVAQAAFEAWEIPMHALRYLWIGLMLLSPMALFFSWRFDITAQGIVRTQPAGQGKLDDTRLKRSDYLVLAALVAVGAAILFQGFGRVQEEIEAQPPVAQVSEALEHSIAVLPFKNLDINAETGFFSDGITEEILHRLSTLKRLHVLASDSSFQFRDSQEGPASITRLLGVRYLLQGSVRRESDHVRVTARLVDASGFQVWSETFDRKLASIFVIQSEIARAVCSEIINEIVPQHELPAGRTTENMEAYNAYLVGRSLVDARSTEWQPKASAAFRQAIALDEGFAPPYAGLAAAMTLNTDFGPHWDEARALAERAVSLDPELANAHAVLGIIQTVLGDQERGLESLRRAIDLDPSLAIAYNWISIALRRLGLSEEADEYLRSGLEIDPLNSSLVRNVAFGESGDGNFERAEQLLLRLTHLPEPPARAFAWMAMVYRAWGLYDKAVEADKSNIRLTGEDIWVLAADYASLGMERAAKDWLALAGPIGPQVAYGVFQTWSDPSPGSKVLRDLENDAIIGTEDAPAYANLYGGLSYLHLGGFERGLELLEWSLNALQLEIRPDHPAGEIDLALLEEFTETGLLIDVIHQMAFAYRQVGQPDRAAALLAALDELYWADGKPAAAHPTWLGQTALQRALTGDLDGALSSFEAAVDLGWADYYRAVNNPTWSAALKGPGFDELMKRVKANIDRQRVAVEAADAEHDFGAEFDLLQAQAQD